MKSYFHRILMSKMNLTVIKQKFTLNMTTSLMILYYVVHVSSYMSITHLHENLYGK